MKHSQTKTGHPPRFASAWQRWRGRADNMGLLEGLPCIPVAAECVKALANPEMFRETLLALIAHARQRILISTLYLQDDAAGREVLSALYEAKKAQPQLDIAIFVDWHRAQRGLIGKSPSTGNVAMYQEMARCLGSGVNVYGVPVQRRELMGVMHLKGFVVDNSILYSGASLNDVYLGRYQRYRLDRYHLIDSEALADSMAALLSTLFRSNPAVHLLNAGKVPTTVAIRNTIAQFRRALTKACYHFDDRAIGPGEVAISPLLGLGVRGNELNATILKLIHGAQQNLVLFTPYFNLPGPIYRALNLKIRAGCRITIVLGDKTANDFYIPPEEPFKTIGALPYLYEANLRRFCKAQQKAIDAGQLNIHLWRHEDNSFHLKGLFVDEDYALLTGNNLNPRAWRLDLENGLLIHDPHKLLFDQRLSELESIMVHTQRVSHHRALDAVETYPIPVQRLLKRLARVRADRLVNQVL